MKTVCKKLFSLLLVAVLLVSALPFQASAAGKITVDFYVREGSEYKLYAGNQHSLATESKGTMVYHVAPEITAPTGMKFLYWVVYTPGMTVAQVNAAPEASLTKYYNENVAFAPAFALDQYTVSFNTGYADIPNPANMTIINGQAFSTAGTMPFPNDTPNGYTFGGWIYGDKVLTATNWASETFNSKANVTLTAKWIPNALTVTFYRWNETNKAYEGIKAVTVSYGETVKAKDIPSSSDVDTKDKYAPNGWLDAPNGNTVNPATTAITANTGFYAKYLGDEVEITLDPEDGKLDNQTKIVRIGEKIGAYGGKLPTPSLTGYVFMGWYDANGNQVTDDDVFWNSYSTLYAKWAPQGNVRLIVYKEGDYTTPIVDRKIPGGVRGGTLDVDKIQIGDYLPAGNTYKLTGYFDQDGWTDFTKNRIINTVDFVQVSSNDETAVYAIVSVVSGNNTNTGSGSNNTGSGNNNTNTNKPADPTNPATGDNSMIFASMTVMTLAAAALVVVMQLRKRKMI